MDSCLERYISNEYLVSPCPRPGVQETDFFVEVRAALERAHQTLLDLRNHSAQDEQSDVLFFAMQSELSLAAALLESAAKRAWLA